jgi:aminocarboxymuconate-semialdehyde decarboxylase
MRSTRRDFLATLGLTALTAGCASSARVRGSRGYSVPVIDAHAHWYPREFVSLLENEGEANGARMGRDAQGNTVVRSVPGSTQTSVLRKNMIEPDLIIAEMDERGIDMYALSMTNPMVYWAPPAFALRLSQAANDACAAVHVKYPQRFVGSIMLPLQDTRLALEELERAAKLPGMCAINMGTHVNGRNLHEREFWPVYARCEALGLPLFLHNLYPLGAERLQDNYLINVLGNPYEDGVAAASLVAGGVMDAFPGLEVYLPHGGGTFPWVIGRFDYAIGVSPALAHMKQPASAYLKRFYYDVIVFNAQIMRDLIDLVGVDRIVMGTDFPQVMGVRQPIEFIESVPRLSLHEREMILSLNAQRMLKR